MSKVVSCRDISIYYVQKGYKNLLPYAFYHENPTFRWDVPSDIKQSSFIFEMRTINKVLYSDGKTYDCAYYNSGKVQSTISQHSISIQSLILSTWQGACEVRLRIFDKDENEYTTHEIITDGTTYSFEKDNPQYRKWGSRNDGLYFCYDSTINTVLNKQDVVFKFTVGMDQDSNQNLQYHLQISDSPLFGQGLKSSSIINVTDPNDMIISADNTVTVPAAFQMIRDSQLWEKQSITSLRPNIIYYCRARSFDGYDYSDWSIVNAVKTICNDAPICRIVNVTFPQDRPNGQVLITFIVYDDDDYVGASLCFSMQVTSQEQIENLKSYGIYTRINTETKALDYNKELETTPSGLIRTRIKQSLFNIPTNTLNTITWYTDKQMQNVKKENVYLYLSVCDGINECLTVYGNIYIDNEGIIIDRAGDSAPIPFWIHGKKDLYLTFPVFPQETDRLLNFGDGDAVITTETTPGSIGSINDETGCTNLFKYYKNLQEKLPFIQRITGGSSFQLIYSDKYSDQYDGKKNIGNISSSSETISDYCRSEDGAFVSFCPHCLQEIDGKLHILRTVLIKDGKEYMDIKNGEEINHAQKQAFPNGYDGSSYDIGFKCLNCKNIYTIDYRYQNNLCFTNRMGYNLKRYSFYKGYNGQQHSDNDYKLMMDLELSKKNNEQEQSSSSFYQVFKSFNPDTSKVEIDPDDPTNKNKWGYYDKMIFYNLNPRPQFQPFYSIRPPLTLPYHYVVYNDGVRLNQCILTDYMHNFHKDDYGGDTDILMSKLANQKPWQYTNKMISIYCDGKSIMCEDSKGYLSKTFDEAKQQSSGTPLQKGNPILNVCYDLYNKSVAWITSSKNTIVYTRFSCTMNIKFPFTVIRGINDKYKIIINDQDVYCGSILNDNVDEQTCYFPFDKDGEFLYENIYAQYVYNYLKNMIGKFFELPKNGAGEITSWLDIDDIIIGDNNISFTVYGKCKPNLFKFELKNCECSCYELFSIVPYITYQSNQSFIGVLQGTDSSLLKHTEDLPGIRNDYFYADDDNSKKYNYDEYNRGRYLHTAINRYNKSYDYEESPIDNVIQSEYDKFDGITNGQPLFTCYKDEVDINGYHFKYTPEDFLKTKKIYVRKYHVETCNAFPRKGFGGSQEYGMRNWMVFPIKGKNGRYYKKQVLNCRGIPAISKQVYVQVNDGKDGNFTDYQQYADYGKLTVQQGWFSSYDEQLEGSLENGNIISHKNKMIEKELPQGGTEEVPAIITVNYKQLYIQNSINPLFLDNQFISLSGEKNIKIIIKTNGLKKQSYFQYDDNKKCYYDDVNKYSLKQVYQENVFNHWGIFDSNNQQIYMSNQGNEYLFGYTFNSLVLTEKINIIIQAQIDNRNYKFIYNDGSKCYIDNTNTYDLKRINDWQLTYWEIGKISKQHYLYLRQQEETWRNKITPKTCVVFDYVDLQQAMMKNITDNAQGIPPFNHKPLFNFGYHGIYKDQSQLIKMYGQYIMGDYQLTAQQKELQNDGKPYQKIIVISSDSSEKSVVVDLPNNYRQEMINSIFKVQEAFPSQSVNVNIRDKNGNWKMRTPIRVMSKINSDWNRELSALSKQSSSSSVWELPKAQTTVQPFVSVFKSKVNVNEKWGYQPLPCVYNYWQQDENGLYNSKYIPLSNRIVHGIYEDPYTSLRISGKVVTQRNFVSDKTFLSLDDNYDKLPYLDYRLSCYVNNLIYDYFSGYPQSQHPSYDTRPQPPYPYDRQWRIGGLNRSMFLQNGSYSYGAYIDYLKSYDSSAFKFYYLQKQWNTYNRIHWFDIGNEKYHTCLYAQKYDDDGKIVVGKKITIKTKNSYWDQSINLLQPVQFWNGTEFEEITNGSWVIPYNKQVSQMVDTKNSGLQQNEIYNFELYLIPKSGTNEPTKAKSDSFTISSLAISPATIISTSYDSWTKELTVVFRFDDAYGRKYDIVGLEYVAQDMNGDILNNDWKKADLQIIKGDIENLSSNINGDNVPSQSFIITHVIKINVQYLNIGYSDSFRIRLLSALSADSQGLTMPDFTVVSWANEFLRPVEYNINSINGYKTRWKQVEITTKDDNGNDVITKTWVYLPQQDAIYSKGSIQIYQEKIDLTNKQMNYSYKQMMFSMFSDMNRFEYYLKYDNDPISVTKDIKWNDFYYGYISSSEIQLYQSVFEKYLIYRNYEQLFEDFKIKYAEYKVNGYYIINYESYDQQSFKAFFLKKNGLTYDCQNYYQSNKFNLLYDYYSYDDIGNKFKEEIIYTIFQMDYKELRKSFKEKNIKSYEQYYKSSSSSSSSSEISSSSSAYIQPQHDEILLVSGSSYKDFNREYILVKNEQSSSSSSSSNSYERIWKSSNCKCIIFYDNNNECWVLSYIDYPNNAYYKTKYNVSNPYNAIWTVCQGIGNAPTVEKVYSSQSSSSESSSSSSESSSSSSSQSEYNDELIIQWINGKQLHNDFISYVASSKKYYNTSFESRALIMFNTYNVNTVVTILGRQPIKLFYDQNKIESSEYTEWKQTHQYENISDTYFSFLQYIKNKENVIDYGELNHKNYFLNKEANPYNGKTNSQQLSYFNEQIVDLQNELLQYKQIKNKLQTDFRTMAISKGFFNNGFENNQPYYIQPLQNNEQNLITNTCFRWRVQSAQYEDVKLYNYDDLSPQDKKIFISENFSRYNAYLRFQMDLIDTFDSQNGYPLRDIYKWSQTGGITQLGVDQDRILMADSNAEQQSEKNPYDKKLSVKFSIPKQLFPGKKQGDILPQPWQPSIEQGQIKKPWDEGTDEWKSAYFWRIALYNKVTAPHFDFMLGISIIRESVIQEYKYKHSIYFNNIYYHNEIQFGSFDDILYVADKKLQNPFWANNYDSVVLKNQEVFQPYSDNALSWINEQELKQGRVCFPTDRPRKCESSSSSVQIDYTKDNIDNFQTQWIPPSPIRKKPFVITYGKKYLLFSYKQRKTNAVQHYTSSSSSSYEYVNYFENVITLSVGVSNNVFGEQSVCFPKYTYQSLNDIISGALSFENPYVVYNENGVYYMFFNVKFYNGNNFYYKIYRASTNDFENWYDFTEIIIKDNNGNIIYNMLSPAITKHNDVYELYCSYLSNVYVICKSTSSDGINFVYDNIVFSDLYNLYSPYIFIDENNHRKIYLTMQSAKDKSGNSKNIIVSVDSDNNGNWITSPLVDNINASIFFVEKQQVYFSGSFSNLSQCSNPCVIYDTDYSFKIKRMYYNTYDNPYLWDNDGINKKIDNVLQLTIHTDYFEQYHWEQQYITSNNAVYYASQISEQWKKLGRNVEDNKYYFPVNYFIKIEWLSDIKEIFAVKIPTRATNNVIDYLLQGLWIDYLNVSQTTAVLQPQVNINQNYNVVDYTYSNFIWYNNLTEEYEEWLKKKSSSSSSSSQTNDQYLKYLFVIENKYYPKYLWWSRKGNGIYKYVGWNIMKRYFLEDSSSSSSMV